MSLETNDINITKSGWLSKQCKYRKKWRKVWFVLHSSQLMYGDTEQVSYIVMLSRIFD